MCPQGSRMGIRFMSGKNKFIFWLFLWTQGPWDPSEAAFAVLNQETGPDITSVYMTVAADLVISQVSSVLDPGSGAFLIPGSGIVKNQDPDPGWTFRFIFPRA